MFHKNQSWHYVEICKKLGYQFKSKHILLAALTRRTALIEGKQLKHIGDYQRLEFLGDKVINLAVSDILFEQHPDWSESQLTTMVASLVNNKGPLAMVASTLGLSDYLILGADEERRCVNENTKVLSDAIEALFGAVFIDSGRDYAVIRGLVEKHWSVLGEFIENEVKDNRNKVAKAYQFEDELDKAIIVAYEIGDDDKFLFLLKQGANPNLVYETRDDYGETMGEPYGISLLMMVLRDRNRTLVAALLEKGADPNWQGTYELVDFHPFPKPTATLNELAKHQSDIRRVETQYSALHWLIVDDHQQVIDESTLELVQLLLDYGADPALVDYRGNTPIMCLSDVRDNKFDEHDMKLKKLLEMPLREKLPKPSSKQLTSMFSSLVSNSMLTNLSLAIPEQTSEDLEDLVNSFS